MDVPGRIEPDRIGIYFSDHCQNLAHHNTAAGRGWHHVKPVTVKLFCYRLAPDTFVVSEITKRHPPTLALLLVDDQSGRIPGIKTIAPASGNPLKRFGQFGLFEKIA